MVERCNVHLAPKLVEPQELARSTVAVIDLLRASTTICHAMAAGAREIVPFVEVDDVRQAAETARSGGEAVLCGGERGGVRIDGFQLGNSPREYTSDVVADKRILFTTSNGTRALHHAKQAASIYIAALVNLSAVVEVITKRPQVDILCAGSGGDITREDVIAAGGYVQRLAMDDTTLMNDSARIALACWRDATGRGSDVLSAISEGRHGKHLLQLDCEADLSVCAAMDALSVVPKYDSVAGSITAGALC